MPYLRYTLAQSLTGLLTCLVVADVIVRSTLLVILEESATDLANSSDDSLYHECNENKCLAYLKR